MFSCRILQTQHANRARGRPTFQDAPSKSLLRLSSNPCANGSNTPRSADRSRRVGTRVDWSCSRRCLRSNLCTLGSSLCWGCAVRSRCRRCSHWQQVVRWCDGRGGDGGAAAPGGRRWRWIGDWCCIGCCIPEPPRLGSCLARPLGSGQLRLGLSTPFRHLQSANVVDAQMCSKEKLIDQHANATERRGHLGLKRRKSLGRSAVITSGW